MASVAARPESVRPLRERLLEHGLLIATGVPGLFMLATLGLDATVAPANDPFFERRGRMLAATQREQSLESPAA